MLKKDIVILLERFYYNALISMKSLDEHNVAKRMTDIGMHSLNFDFSRARSVYEEVREHFDKATQQVFDLNFRDLLAGDPDAIFSEMIWSMKIQVRQEQYIDFLGRLYRFNEAFFKYLFASHELKRPINLFDEVFEENRLLRILRKKYRIYHGNIIFAVERYFRAYHRDNTELIKTLEKMVGPKMKKLVELRHSSIVGHGFHAVGEAQIEEAYGPSAEVIQDLQEALMNIGIRVYDSKYHRLNQKILSLLEDRNDLI